MEEERQEREGRREERETPVHLNEEETRWLEIRSRDFVDFGQERREMGKSGFTKRRKTDGRFLLCKGRISRDFKRGERDGSGR